MATRDELAAFNEASTQLSPLDVGRYDSPRGADIRSTANHRDG